jgi:SAM-dependent methyltransferase
MTFYADMLKRLIADGSIDPTLPTLVVAGGQTDMLTLQAAGFTDVVISNLDPRYNDGDFAPYGWLPLDGENLDVEPGRFAQIIVHLALHHFGSPHRGLLEMYRCAGKSVLAMENRDSLSMRLAERLGFVQRFEFHAVSNNEFRYGGWRSTDVPNAVYRWTEHEVRKTLRSWDPAHQVPVRFFHHLRLPYERIATIRNPLMRWLFLGCLAPFWLFTKLFPRQCNDLAIFIDKGARQPQPWIDPETGGLSERSWSATGWKLG